MAIRQVRVLGDDILQKTARPVENFNPAIHSLLDDMLETLRDKEGVGLAAPQVGVLRRIVVVEWEENLYELINPVIIKEKGNQRCNEACLSVAGKQGDVLRPRHVTVEALDRNGNTYTVKGNEFLASVLCHELDHLDGVLYIDKAYSVTDRKKDD